MSAIRGAIGVISVIAAGVAPAAPPGDELARCRQIADALDRLACYDRLADARGDDGAEADAASAETARPPQSAEDRFGMSAGVVEEAREPERLETLEARVGKVDDVAPDRVALWLTNGQVWVQTVHSPLRLSEGDRVVIERGSFGSYVLREPGRDMSMRVRRER